MVTFTIIYIYILYLFIYIGDIQLSIIYIYNGETHPCLAGGFSSQIDSRDTSPFVIKNVWNLPHGTYLYGTANGNIYNNIYTIYNYRYIGYIQHSISLRIYIYIHVCLYTIWNPLFHQTALLLHSASRGDQGYQTPPRVESSPLVKIGTTVWYGW